MKKSRIIVFIIGLCLIVCVILLMANKREVNNEDPLKVIEKLNNIKSSTCDIKIKITNDKQTLNYEGTQTYIKDEERKLKLKNNTEIICKNEETRILDDKNGIEYIVGENYDCIYKLSFIDEFIKFLYLEDSIIYEYKTINETKFLLLSFKVPEYNRNFDRGVVYIDCVHNLPRKIIVYDVYNEQKAIILYENYNVSS